MNTIHKTEVLTILRSIVARLEAMGPDSDWSREPTGYFAGRHQTLDYSIQFWRADLGLTLDDLKDRQIKELERGLQKACHDVVRLEAANSNLIAENNRLNHLLSPAPESGKWSDGTINDCETD